MNVEQIVTIGMQLPIVALFIWYSERKDKQFLDFLREERQARKEQSDNTIKELSALSSILTDFRNETAASIKVMQDRTRRGDDIRNSRE